MITCWSMCAESRYSSPMESSGESSAKSPERDREREERGAVPPCVILPPPPPQPDKGLPEERQCERRARENGDRRLPGGGDRLVMAGVREDQGAASTWPSTQSPVKVYPTIRSMSGT